MEKTIDMTQGNPMKLLVRFSLPILIGYLFQQVYTLADRIIVGQFVGANAFSAVGSTTAITSMFMSMCMGISTGTGVVVAQYHGAGDEKRTAAAIANGVYINLIITVIMMVVSLMATNPILRLLNTPETLMRDASSYMMIYMGGLIAVTAYYVPFSILQALGDSKTPLIFLIFCSILNIVLDIIFVVPLGMGVNGAAIATIFAQIIAAVCCVAYTYKKISVVRLALKNARPDRNLLVKMTKLGIPTGFQYSLMYLSSIILQRVVNGFGESVIGAFTATTQMEVLVEQIYTSMGAAMVTYTGQNMGADRIDRIGKGLRDALSISTLLSVLIMAVFWLFANPIMGIFVDDYEIISIAARGIRITSLFFVAFGAVRIIRYLFSGAGDAVYSLMNGVIEIAARIMLVLFLTSIPSIGIWGIWFTTGLTWLITALFALWRYKSGKWKTKALISK